MTFKELQDAVYDDISTTSTDSFFPVALVKRYINRQFRRVAGLYPWPHTKTAEMRTSEANQEYLNYPEDWVQDSIYRVEYNGTKYIATDFNDYEDYKKENSNHENRFANYENKVFMTPVPTVNIVNGISIWGHKLPANMVNDSDLNQFTEDPEIEEEVVKLVIAKLMQKQRGSYLAQGVAMEKDAIATITAIWKKVYMKKAKFMTRDRAMFNPVNILQQPSNKSLGNWQSFIDNNQQ